MTTSSDALRSSIRDAVDEDHTYQANVHASVSLPAMMIEVDGHHARMTAILGDMHTDMSSMMHCTGAGGMMTLRDDLGSELASHIAAMHDESALEPARVEADRHVGAMGSMLDDMGSMMDVSHCGD